jgi:predicted metal-dependent hydrolase
MTRRHQRPSEGEVTLPGFAASSDAAPPSPLRQRPSSEPFQVEVVRSTRRKRTVEARLVGDVLRLSLPSWMSAADEAHWIETMSARYRRKLHADRIDLDERSMQLARRYELPRAHEIRWSDDMLHRWGSCTPSTATVRISTRIARFPDWVVDYVIVHELAHIAVPDHSAEFWQLVHRYPKAERATGYLIAKSGDESID